MNHVMRYRKPNLVSKVGSMFILSFVQVLSACGPSDIWRKTWRELTVGWSFS